MDSTSAFYVVKNPVYTPLIPRMSDQADRILERVLCISFVAGLAFSLYNIDAIDDIGFKIASTVTFVSGSFLALRSIIVIDNPNRNMAFEKQADPQDEQLAHIKRVVACELVKLHFKKQSKKDWQAHGMTQQEETSLKESSRSTYKKAKERQEIELKQFVNDEKLLARFEQHIDGELENSRTQLEASRLAIESYENLKKFVDKSKKT